MRVNLPERHATSLRATQSVQVNVFKAYVGGVYRDQGLEVARKWLILVIRPHVEAVYQNMRNYFIHEAIPQPLVPIPKAPYPSPPSSASSEGAGPALQSRDPDDRHRSLPPARVNVPQQGPRRVGGGVDENVDQSRSNRRRRRYSQGNGRSGGSDRTWSPHCRTSPTGSDWGERTSKRQRY